MSQRARKMVYLAKRIEISAALSESSSEESPCSDDEDFVCNSDDKSSTSNESIKSEEYNRNLPNERQLEHIQPVICVQSPTDNYQIHTHEILDEVPGDGLANNGITSVNKQTIQQINGIKRRRKHYCIFCDTMVNNFARHLERLHNEEVQVQEYIHLDKLDPKRKHLIDKIRKEGDFCSGTVILVQDKIPAVKDNSDVCDNLPCIYCKGYYAKKGLRKHVKRCFFNKNKSIKGRHQADGHTLMAKNFGPNDPLRTSGILQSLRADEISLVAKRDKIICEVARKYLRSHKDPHLIQVAKRYMRRLARLLIEVRKLENNKTLTLLSILHPSKFKSIIQATINISDYDCSTKIFKSPSLALQLGTIIKKAISSAYSTEVQSNVNSSLLTTLNIMKQLIDEEWASEISSEASQNINLNRYNKPTAIPMAEDIAKMKTYLELLVSTSQRKLENNEHDVKAYKLLTEAMYCNLLLFNKRRVGELQRILLDTYFKYINNNPTGDFEKIISPSERILLKNLKRIVIKGKRGRGVPVLIDKSTQEGLKLIVTCRKNFFSTYNPYLFAQIGTDQCISGYHIFRKHVGLALGDLNKTSSLTSTKLRKHLATIAQILKMDSGELEQLATFMGHTSKTHAEWYRLPSDIYQTAKVSKILVLAQKNSIEKYKGCKLDELDVDDQIVETVESDSDSDNEGIKRDVNEVGSGTSYQNTAKRKKIVRKAWSPQEKKVTTEFFKNHIKKRIPPKQKEVLALMEQNKDLFKDRKWDVIKAFVCNLYNKKK